MRTGVAIVALLICTMALLISPEHRACWSQASIPAVRDSRRQHVEWVADSLKRMQTIRPGMTRAELLKVFTTEGGFSTGIERTYVYQGCPFFKVDVKFRPVGRPERDKDDRVTLAESPKDLIKTISRPYIAWSVAD